MTSLSPKAQEAAERLAEFDAVERAAVIRAAQDIVDKQCEPDVDTCPNGNVRPECTEFDPCEPCWQDIPFGDYGDGDA